MQLIAIGCVCGIYGVPAVMRDWRISSSHHGSGGGDASTAMDYSGLIYSEFSSLRFLLLAACALLVTLYVYDMYVRIGIELFRLHLLTILRSLSIHLLEISPSLSLSLSLCPHKKSHLSHQDQPSSSHLSRWS